MKQAGFFTRKSAAEARAAKRSQKGSRVRSADLIKLGPSALRGMNPKAKNPEMPCTGPEDAMVYVLGGCPNEADDRKGVPFAGQPGELLRDALPRWGEAETRFDNCVRTCPPDGRVPKYEEVECFRGAIVDSIASTKPHVILGLGPSVLKWALPLDKPNIKAMRGKLFPVCIGGHSCWFAPTLHPDFICKIEGSRDDKVPSQEWARFFEQDVRRAYELADKVDSGEADAAKVESSEDALANVHRCTTLAAVRHAVSVLSKAEALGMDTESHRLRPYSHDAMLLTIALSDGDQHFAIPIDHPGTAWADKRSPERREVLGLLKSLFVTDPGCGKKPPVIVCHNLPHDYEWALATWGADIHTGRWGCSQQAAFALNPGPPGMGAAGHRLEDLCLEHFGLPLKSMTPGARDVTRLRELPVNDVLDYNALDAKWCLKLWERLIVKIDEMGLRASYDLQIERVPAIVNAQAMGVPISEVERKKLETDIKQQISEVERAIAADESVIKWSEKMGEQFNPSSPQQVGKLLGEGVGIAGVKTASGGFSTSAAVLEQYREKHPLIDQILKMRGLGKLLGTYVDRFDPKSEDSYVYPDGKIHCKFSIARARTARLASDSPNNQNWPKRKNKHVRKQLRAPDGHVFVAVDQGQIEARVLAMESCDPTWVRMIEDQYDVHSEWAAKIATIDPAFERLLKEEPKQARHKAKNGWVFPAFYGSSLSSIVATLELSNSKAAERLFKQFWKTFAGVKQWQKRQWKKYEKRGFVSSLTGRRRWGPLSYNMVINTPIQCAASDICVDAMVRLFWRSREEGKPWMAPLLQIHDDLTFIVPKSELSYAISAIVEEQLSFKAEWVNVPLSVEVEVGQDLCDMKAVGEWSSADLL
tara:strand:+ start:819 stop:3434 length:2616 start_codon:yes stop_codon:yes gene_type:complete